MEAATQTAPKSKSILVGRIISGLIVLFLLSANIFGMIKFQDSVKQMARYGYSEGAALWITVAFLLCTVLYAVPQTAVFGAIMLTAYLGGAVSTHVRAGEPFIFPIIVAVLAWLGIFLRDGRLRALVPLRR